MEKFVLDLDHLHKVALGEVSGRGCGKTVFFAYQLLGVAQTGAFDFSKNESKVVYIVFNKPANCVREIIKTVHRICESESIFCKIEPNYAYLQILGTIFSFVKILNDDCERGFAIDPSWVWWNTDACWPPNTSIDEIMNAHAKSVCAPGFNITITR